MEDTELFSEAFVEVSGSLLEETDVQEEDVKESR